MAHVLNMAPQLNRAPCQKGVLYVEVMLNDKASSSFRVAEIKTGVAEHIRRHHREVQIGQGLSLGAPLAEAVARIEISGHSRSRVFPDESFHCLLDSDLEITVFTLYSHSDRESEADGYQDEVGNECLPRKFNVTNLPHKDFEGLWESLIYDEPIKDFMLRTVTRGIHESLSISKAQYTGPWQCTVLIHGPPGSGKTSLAQALAQRLSIRLSNIYSHTIFVEVKSSSLLSRYFGESSKRVADLFYSISSMALDESQLTIVFFDEVESIASCREKASQTNEVVDAIRSTNAILQGLDHFRTYPNVIFMFTTNLFASLDSAFVSRCFIKEFINIPATDCTYEILRAELNRLIQSDKVYLNDLFCNTGLMNEYVPSDESSDLPSTRISKHAADIGSPLPLCRIPDLQWASTHLPKGPITAVSELYRIAALAKGIAGRNLRGLIMLARYRHMIDDPCDLRDLLHALELVILKETGQSRCDVESEPVHRTDESIQESETVGIGDFLSQLEVDGSIGSCNNH